jgi:hypothetical protein
MTLGRDIHENVAVRIRHVENLAAYERDVLRWAFGDDQFGWLGSHNDLRVAQLRHGRYAARIALRGCERLVVPDQIAYA